MSRFARKSIAFWAFPQAAWYKLRPARLAKLEKLFQTDAARPAVDHSRRLAELDREIQNIGDAIAKGLLSDALAKRLQAAETERNRLTLAQVKRLSEPRRLPAMTLARRVEAMRKRIAAGGETARSVMRELFPKSIWLQPDNSGRFLWACFSDGVGSALFDQEVTIDFPLNLVVGNSMVAGVGFEPTTSGL